MLVVLRKMWRFVLRAITCGFYDPEDGELDSRQAIENLRAELADLRASVGKILACQCRLERELTAERKKLADLMPDSNLAELSRARIAELEVQLDAARVDSDAALAKLRQFRERLQQVDRDARHAQLSTQLAQMRAQIEQIALDQSLDENFAALERLNDDARDAVSRAEALHELNASLREDISNIQEDEPGEQRITGSDSGDK